VTIGAITGSGGMVVMDDQTNMVELAQFYMQFCMDESCGKCIPCRAGTVETLRSIIFGHYQEHLSVRRNAWNLLQMFRRILHAEADKAREALPWTKTGEYDAFGCLNLVKRIDIRLL
jgi:bidirectional [NiFe] hydrogenase diaphorase subunit